MMLYIFNQTKVYRNKFFIISMENMQNMQGMKNMCKCPHHKVVPVLVVLFGVTFLLGAWGTLSWGTVNVVWPILVILAGLIKIGEKSGMCKCC